MSDEDKQQAGSPWGPENPQALNRYSYVQNNPLRWTDPIGHSVYMNHTEAYQYAKGLRTLSKIMTTIAGAAGSMSRKAFVSLLLDSIAELASAGVITSAVAASLTAIAGLLVIPGLIADVAAFAWRLGQLADKIDQWNGSEGVVLASECYILTCDITIIDRQSGNGVVWNAPKIVFGPILGSEEYLPGKAVTRDGQAVSGPRWFRDQ